MKVDLANVRLRVDHNRRVALEYDRGPKLSKWLAFTPYGLEKFEDPTSTFERLFYKALNQPLETAALRLLQSTRSAYLPADGATTILLEIFIMTKTNSADINTLDLKGLVALYNELAVVAGKTAVKNFKSKGEALKRIEAIKADTVAPTEQQKEHKTERAEAAAKRLAGVEKKPAKAAKPVAAKPTKEAAPKKTVATKLAAKADKVAGDAKPRGQGIGAFCMELIKNGKNNEEVLTAVAKKYPDAKTSAASVAWYRNKLKSDGLAV